jgi:hypothetical protein
MSGETPPETQPKTRSTSRKAKIQSNPDRKLTSRVSRSNPPRGWAIIMMRASSAISMATIWSVFEPTGRAKRAPDDRLRGTGSCEENASKQKTRGPFRFHRNGKGSGLSLHRGGEGAARPAKYRTALIFAGAGVV